MILKTMAEIRTANVRAGHYFFSRGAMQHFNSRIERGGPYIDRAARRSLFVTSESDDLHGRRYTVRAAYWDTGDVRTVGGFMEHSMVEHAREAARAAKGR